jgi:hypothetical protein
MRLSMVFLVIFLCLVPGCDFKKRADQEFGDQHFKTAIALIELHKTRYGEYPDTLDDLKFIGQWDRIALASVEYERLGDGYSLNLSRGWLGKPTLEYPEEFWQGLGIRASNQIQPTGDTSADKGVRCGGGEGEGV